MASEKDMIVVGVRLDGEIRDLALQVARAKGIDLSEHIRSLILADLDNRCLVNPRLRPPAP
jgi:antitoxin component of RelBE/YafQ-DinJ toxin-antitoxin module